MRGFLVRRIGAAIAAIAVASGSFAASADSGRQSRAETDQTRRVAAAFARCIVNKAPRAASDFVLSSGVRGRSLSRNRLLLDSECLYDQPGAQADMLQSSSLYFAYEFAGALIRTKLTRFDGDLKSAPQTQDEKLHPVSITVQPRANESAAEIAKEQAQARAIMTNVTVDMFAYCVVRSDSARAHALLMTEVATTAEQEQLAALQSAMDNCLPVGEQIRADLTTIRGAIALAYYRLAIASDPQLAPGGKGGK